MRVEILRDADHRVAPAVVQAFKAGTILCLPQKTAQSLIAAGAAKRVKPIASKELRDG